MDCSMLAGLDAIHANHASAVIYFMLLAVDAGSFAFVCTESAIIAFLGVNYRAKQCVFRQKAQNGTNGTDGVAVSPSVFPS